MYLLIKIEMSENEVGVARAGIVKSFNPQHIPSPLFYFFLLLLISSEEEMAIVILIKTQIRTLSSSDFL